MISCTWVMWWLENAVGLVVVISVVVVSVAMIVAVATVAADRLGGYNSGKEPGRDRVGNGVVSRINHGDRAMYRRAEDGVRCQHFLAVRGDSQAVKDRPLAVMVVSIELSRVSITVTVLLVSPGSRRSITSPRATKSKRHFDFSLTLKLYMVCSKKPDAGRVESDVWAGRW